PPWRDRSGQRLSGNAPVSEVSCPNSIRPVRPPESEIQTTCGHRARARPTLHRDNESTIRCWARGIFVSCCFVRSMTKLRCKLKRKIGIASSQRFVPMFAMRHPKSIVALAFASIFATAIQTRAGTNNDSPITRDMVIDAQKMIGLDFPDSKIDLMQPDLEEQRETFERLRKFPLSNAVPSAMLFNPIPVGMKFETARKKFKMSPTGKVKLPENLNDLAFYSVEELATLIKSRRITSTQLTRLYLDRMKKYGTKLHCVVTLTEELALKQATEADKEIAAGHYRGPLHGIP